MQSIYEIKETFPIQKVIGERYLLFTTGFGRNKETYVYDMRMEQTRKMQELTFRQWAAIAVHRSTRR